MRKIALVVGTRPELIKMASTIHALKKNSFEFKLISTNQQGSLLNQTAQSLGINFDYILSERPADSDIVSFIASGLTELASVLREIRPDRVLVHGDTLSTLIGMMSAFFLNIQVSHVEAGLRTGDLSNPWPEEGIRRIVDVIANQLFVPTVEDLANLKIEFDQKVFVTGNSGVDAILDYGIRLPAVERFQLEPRIVLVTLHRRESHDLEIGRLLMEIRNIAIDSKLVFNVIRHPNPNVNTKIDEVLNSSNVKILEPMGFTDMMKKLTKVWACLTDSGGLALDCSYLGIPVGVLRDTIEAKSLIQFGSAKLLGRKSGAIESFLRELENQKDYFTYSNAPRKLGDGNAWRVITDNL